MNNKRKLFATVLVILLAAATLLTVFAAFRFEVQFPSKLNTFTYDDSQAKFEGEFSQTMNLSEPGSSISFSATVVGDKDVAEQGEKPARAGTPLTYSYKLTLGNDMNVESNKIYVEKSKRVVDMALDMETNIVTTHIGVVPEDKNAERYKIMQEACYELAQYADSVGAHFAVETGPETSAGLAIFWILSALAASVSILTPRI